MNTSSEVREALKEIPSVDTILEKYKDSLNSAPYILYINRIRDILDSVRKEILRGKKISHIPDYINRQISNAISSISLTNVKEIINGTGIILHTGLGRAPLDQRLIDKAISRVIRYTNLELDLESGKRGERNKHVEILLTSLTGSEAALVVNNNAAAVLIMLNSIAEGKEVKLTQLPSVVNIKRKSIRF